MGKLAVLTDLHVDINHLAEADLQSFRAELQRQGITHFHLAGDLANKVERAVATAEFFQEVVPTTFHWGNHEMADITAEGDFEDFDHPQFLNFKTIELSENLVLIGVNGWYDYQFSDMKDQQEIVRLKNLFWYDRMIDRAGTDPEISQRVSARLEETLQQIPATQQVIVATHFVPRAEFIVQHTGKYTRWNHLNAFLGAKGFGESLAKFANVQQVVFGHTHRRFGTEAIDGVTYHCRPFGYFFEWRLTRDFVLNNQLAESFNPTKMRGLLRKNQEAFDQYKQAHLLEEFQRSLTIIPY